MRHDRTRNLNTFKRLFPSRLKIAFSVTSHGNVSPTLLRLTVKIPQLVPAAAHTAGAFRARE